MSPEMLLLPILIPAIAGVLCLACVRGLAKLSGAILIAATLVNIVVAAMLFRQEVGPLSIVFGGFDLTLAFRLDAFSRFILLSAAGFGVVLAFYAVQFMSGKSTASPFFGFYLLTLSLVQGAVLADHLVTLLFFWEGMLGTMFAMIAIGRPGAYKTAVKAFFINGVTDLCLMAGIGLVYFVAHTASISTLREAPLGTEGVAGLAFVMLLVGAISKAGAMPFHSWIPDAAVDAPLPFMAFMPAAMEKLLGIYLTGRVAIDLFKIEHGWASTMMMVIGCVTILLAVLMALIQKDFKRLLSFHAISQVGYMILGIGTGTPVGIVGGLFHMVNHAMYKSTLFLTGGAVERQVGTTDLKRISGLGRAMPITFGCFIIAALAISGFPLTNGFYSKEMIYDGALERGGIFYVAAALGSFFTAASFLKLGHAAFKGPFKAPKAETEVKDPPIAMLVPMMIIAGFCLLFGVGNSLPLNNLVIPSVATHLEGHTIVTGPIPHTWGLVAISLVVMTLAALNHAFGAKRYGSGLKAVDHIHYAPVAHQLYDAAEKRWFDPYELALKAIQGVAYAGYAVDRAIDFLYNKIVTGIAAAFSGFLREAHSGSHAVYLMWSVMGAALVVLYFVGGF